VCSEDQSDEFREIFQKSLEEFFCFNKVKIFLPRTEGGRTDIDKVVARWSAENEGA
jgi:hypothetical protein